MTKYLAQRFKGGEVKGEEVGLNLPLHPHPHHLFLPCWSCSRQTKTSLTSITNILTRGRFLVFKISWCCFGRLSEKINQIYPDIMSLQGSHTPV